MNKLYIYTIKKKGGSMLEVFGSVNLTLYSLINNVWSTRDL